MRFAFSRHRGAVVGISLMVLTAAAGCKNDKEAEVGSIKLMAGTQTITITMTGSVGGPIIVTHGQSVALSATFFKADGTVETLVTGPTFRLDVTPAASNVTFSRTGDFTGNLNGVTAGTTTIAVTVLHVVDNQNRLGPVNVPVTVN
jgi:hypothetical protein